MKKEEKKSQILWQLFKATFLLSAFTFGGGFVIVSLMKKKFVEELGWLDESEMLDNLRRVPFQSTPRSFWVIGCAASPARWSLSSAPLYRQ
mgnify:CR=1 FL=1